MSQDKQVVNGFFKPSASLDMCVNNLHRFQDVSFGTLISSDKKPRLFKIQAVYLYATKSQKKYRMYAPAKGNLAAVNKEITTFDRFLVLGIPSSPHVVTMFLKTPAATKLNLKFSQHLSPGSPLYVIMPRIVSFLSPQNPEIVSSDPLIPVANNTFQQLYTLPPADVDSPNFTWFDFASTTVEVFQANASGRSAIVRQASCLVRVRPRYRRKSGCYHSLSCVRSWRTLPETKWSLFPKLFREHS